MRRRWWLFRLFDLLARHWPVLRRRHGLLVVRMDGIGDMVLFRRTLDHYAEVFGVAQSDITVLGCHAWAAIADTVFAGYHVRTINEHAYARQPFYRLRVSIGVKRLAPEFAVLDAFFRRALMADSLIWVSGARRTIVSLPYISERTRAEYSYYLGHCDQVVATGRYPRHEILRHYDFLSRVAGREIAPEAPAIPWRDIPPSTKEGPPPVEEGPPYVVLNPGSNEPGRRWPFADYLEIAGKLRAAGYRVVLVGSGAERPRGDDDRGDDDLGDDSGIFDLIGQTSLPQLLDLMNNAAAVLSNDSGPAHLAIALGTPTLVVVGGGHFGSFVPYPEAVRPANARFLYHEMECYHCFWACHKRRDDGDVFPCVGAVAAEAVWDELEDMLG